MLLPIQKSFRRSKKCKVPFLLPLRGKVPQRCLTQALTITLTLGCGFEDAIGKCGLEHCGLQLSRKAVPGLV